MSLDLSIIIVNYNTAQLTLDCINSIVRNTSGISYEVILVDNMSTENLKTKISNWNSDSKFKVKNFSTIYNKKNLGFTGGNNQGMKIANGRYTLLLNSDTLVNDNVLGEMVNWIDKNSKVGIASCALKNVDGSLQGTGGYFPTLLRVFSWMTIQDLPFVDRFIKPFHPMKDKNFLKNDEFYKKQKEVDWVTGAFMLIRKNVTNEIGFLDEEYFMYTEDTDYCYRAKMAGWKVFFNPKWAITHLGGASSTKEYPILSEFKNVKLFYKKHYPKWQYGVLRFFLKIGCLWRMVLISPKIYGKAFNEI